MNKIENLFVTAVLMAFTLTSCNSSDGSKKRIQDSDIIAKAWIISGGYSIGFRSNHTYKISTLYYPTSCYGEGTWSIENNQIILGKNDSNCETAQNLKGSHPFSDLTAMYKD